MDDRHLIGFLLFVGLTIYTATNSPTTVEPSTLQRWSSDIMASLPSLQLPEDLSSCVPGTFDGTQCIQVCTYMYAVFIL